MGPVLSFIGFYFEPLSITSVLFPVTVESIDIRTALSSEQNLVMLLWPLVSIKIIVFGVICLKGILRNNIKPNLLSRLYILTIVILVVDIIMALFKLDQIHVQLLVIVVRLVWMVVLLLMLQESRKSIESPQTDSSL